MSHQIILGGTGDKGGGLAAQTVSTVSGGLTWTPSHELSPQQERHRIDRANEMLDDVIAMLSAPPGA